MGEGQTRVEDGGFKLIYVKNWKRKKKKKKRDSQRGEGVERSKSEVWPRLVSGATRAEMGHKLNKSQKYNFTNLAFTFTGLIKDSRYFRTNKNKATPNSLYVQKNSYGFEFLF